MNGRTSIGCVDPCPALHRGPGQRPDARRCRRDRRGRGPPPTLGQESSARRAYPVLGVLVCRSSFQQVGDRIDDDGTTDLSGPTYRSAEEGAQAWGADGERLVAAPRATTR